MGRILENIEPAKVFEYFEDICNIPHVSHDTGRMTEYCVNFAKEHGLEYDADEAGNVIVRKNASAGYENAPGVIIQGHIDMVGAKTDDSDHNFSCDPLKLGVKDGYVYAMDTTLGGDDGIAVAYALAILDDDSLKHPAIEAVFTVDEEVGLLGASALDKSLLKGRYLLNIDTEEEGFFITGSAGGLRTDLKYGAKTVKTDGIEMKILIAGLLGGHSGTEIGTGRPSANVLMGRLLKRMDEKADFGLVLLKGGEVDNAISPKCEAVVAACDKDDVLAIKEVCEQVNKEFLSEYRGVDEGIRIVCEESGAFDGYVCTDIDREKIVFLLNSIPYGVMARSPYDINLVETSLNPGVLRFNAGEEGGEFKLGFSVRSSNEYAKRRVTDQIEYLVEFIGGDYEESGDYPSWPYNPDSALREMALETYKEMYGKEAQSMTIHAGLECGIFSNAIPGIDIISFGPDMSDIHTFDEKLYIESTKRVYEFTVRLLEKIR